MTEIYILTNSHIQFKFTAEGVMCVSIELPNRKPAIKQLLKGIGYANVSITAKYVNYMVMEIK